MWMEENSINDKNFFDHHKFFWNPRPKVILFSFTLFWCIDLITRTINLATVVSSASRSRILFYFDPPSPPDVTTSVGPRLLSTPRPLLCSGSAKQVDKIHKIHFPRPADGNSAWFVKTEWIILNSVRLCISTRTRFTVYCCLFADELLCNSFIIWKFNKFDFIINKVFMFDLANIYRLYSLIWCWNKWDILSWKDLIIFFAFTASIKNIQLVIT